MTQPASRRSPSLTPFIASLLLAVTLATAANFKLAAPTGPLNETETKFIGKWSGQRLNLKWEIHRFDDRRFELAFEETDLEDPNVIYTNYAVGSWWANENNYYFEWENWWGDHGDFSGVVKEQIQIASANQVITLTSGAETPENTEIRVAQFSLTGWQHKPKQTSDQPTE